MAVLAGATTANLRSSLPVPSIKEMLTKSLKAVPPRYIRDGEDFTAASLSDPVPVVDMAKLCHPEIRSTELQKLHIACTEWGVFQLINHGVSTKSLKSMYVKIKEFFELPQEDKKRYAQKPGSLEGYGQAFVISEEQKLELCDMIFLKAIPSHARRLEFWPEQPHEFREVLHCYSEDMRKTAVSIVGYIATALGLDSKRLSEAFKDGNYDVRMNCYPPCPEPERVIGVSPRADISGITLLTDCGDIPGLQVLKDGKWVYVEPIADAIVVDIGIILVVVTNGIYKASYHRAAVNRHKDRFSIVTFCFPSKIFEIGPDRELTKAGCLPLYKTMTYEDYFQRFYERTNHNGDGVAFIDTLKI